MVREELRNERPYHLLKELQQQEATLRKLGYKEALALQARADILEAIKENEAERLRKAIPVPDFGDKLDIEWRKQIYDEEEQVDRQLGESAKKQSDLNINQRAQIEVAKSKIAAIKKLLGEDTIKELERLERTIALSGYAREKATAAFL